MPRPSLPASLKNLKTYTTLLTQTKEEDLWKHVKASFPRYEQNDDKHISIFNNILTELDEYNPYAKESWRKGNVKRIYTKDDICGFICNTETELEENIWCLQFNGDIKICNKILKWEEDEEYGQEYRDMAFILDRNRELICSKYQEIEYLDKLRHTQARNKWYKDHEEELEHEKSHKSDNYIEGCSFCLKAKVRADKHKEYLDKKQEQDKLEEEEAKKKDEIRRKELFCSVCNLQTRSPSEMNNHIQTTKHKKAVGDYMKEDKLYECTLCKYSSPFKHVYDAHLKSKKHITAVAENS